MPHLTGQKKRPELIDVQNETDFKILSALKHSDRALSGAKLSESLKLSRTAVWKRIHLLKEIGYVISSQPDGYRLLSIPNHPIPEEIRWHITSAKIPNIQVFKEIDSTNRFLMDLGRRGTQKNHIVVAESQTAGRGRFKREWVSQKGVGMYFSFLIDMSRYPLTSDHLLKLTPLTSVSIIQSLQSKLPTINCKIKWPNDIYLNDKKLAGILTEAEFEEGVLRFAVIGIGLNIRQSETLPPTAIGINEYTNETLDQNRFIADVYDRITAVLNNFHTDAWNDIFQKWASLSMLAGRHITLKTGDTVHVGIVDGFEPNCSIRIKDENGIIKTINSGDATLKD